MADVTRKLSERVATEILEMITLQKRFSPGDKIPTENELCAELGVSRTTVREAIQKLTAQNILEVHRGKGTYVTDSTQTLSSDIFSTLSYTGMRLKDLYEIRLIFEPQAAYYAAQRATDEELAQILEYGQILRESCSTARTAWRSTGCFTTASPCPPTTSSWCGWCPSSTARSCACFPRPTSNRWSTGTPAATMT